VEITVKEEPEEIVIDDPEEGEVSSDDEPLPTASIKVEKTTSPEKESGVEKRIGGERISAVDDGQFVANENMEWTPDDTQILENVDSGPCVVDIGDDEEVPAQSEGKNIAGEEIADEHIAESVQKIATESDKSTAEDVQNRVMESQQVTAEDGLNQVTECQDLSVEERVGNQVIESKQLTGEDIQNQVMESEGSSAEGRNRVIERGGVLEKNETCDGDESNTLAASTDRSSMNTVVAGKSEVNIMQKNVTQCEIIEVENMTITSEEQYKSDNQSQEQCCVEDSTNCSGEEANAVMILKNKTKKRTQESVSVGLKKGTRNLKRAKDKAKSDIETSVIEIESSDEENKELNLGTQGQGGPAEKIDDEIVEIDDDDSNVDPAEISDETPVATENEESQSGINEEELGESWKTRWLSKDSVQKVVKSSKICGLVRKKKIANKKKKPVPEAEPVALEQSDSNSTSATEVYEGSVSEYQRLFSKTNDDVAVQVPTQVFIKKGPVLNIPVNAEPTTVGDENTGKELDTGNEPTRESVETEVVR